MNRVCAVWGALALASLVFAAELPVTNVVLFSSGVGYFQRVGTVQDNATLKLSFKTGQINDLLKSLVLLDLDGGKVGAVTYGAQDPIGKTLGSFAINLTDNPGLGDLLNRLRGTEIEVTATTVITGKILGVEKKKKPVKDEVVEVQYLNILTPIGIRAVNLDEITSFKLLDERLNSELQNALQVLASGLDNDRKPVVVSFNGEKARHVVVGYLLEAPIWKTSYRLVADDKGTLLQGWGIVENASDEDWKDVRLSLVSGRPISFIQDLYTPLYIPRPVVRPQLYASIAPVLHDAGILSYIDKDAAVANGLAGPPPSSSTAGKARSGREVAGDKLVARLDDALVTPEALQQSVISAALARDLGRGFEYAIKDPVTLPRQQSALLPIVTGPVEASRISVFNPAVNAKYPLYGMKLKNTTGVHLMGGPITVYDGGVYAGDATFENLQPGETRLISYAVDLGLTSEQQTENAPERITTLKLSKGTLIATRKYRKTTSYAFQPKDGKARTVVVEHPFTQGWTLVEPKTADERTDRFYRFTVPADGKTGGKLAVVEEYIQSQTYALTGLDSPTLLFYAATAKDNAGVHDALKRAADLLARVVESQRKRALDEQEIAAITQEQQRIRENMNTLDRTSDLYKRLVKKLDEQETRIEALRAHIAEMRLQEETQRKEYEDYVKGLDLAAEI